MGKIVFENIFRPNDVSFNDEGIAVCPYCNGTGLNADFNLFNKVNEQVQFNVIACCIKCYGKGKTDWVEVTNGRIDKIMRYLFSRNRQFLAINLCYFASYVYVGYLVPVIDEIQLWYDENKDKWRETTGIEWPGHIESKNKMFQWIDMFNEHSYIKDPESISTLARATYSSSPNYEYPAKIKCDIIDALALKIEDLITIGNDLKDLGYTIEDLNDIGIIDESGKILEVDFEFTWENLLDKFKLPRQHKYSVVPDSLLTVD